MSWSDANKVRIMTNAILHDSNSFRSEWDFDGIICCSLNCILNSILIDDIMSILSDVDDWSYKLIFDCIELSLSIDDKINWRNDSEHVNCVKPLKCFKS